MVILRYQQVIMVVLLREQTKAGSDYPQSGELSLDYADLRRKPLLSGIVVKDTV